MVSIYALKGCFQDLLRPGVRGLYRLGATANQVTAGAAAVSLLVAAWVFWRAPAQPLWYALLPAWMLLRMGLNAIDGMLAREFGQQSRLGAYLNELSDVIADAALYLSLASVPGVGAGWLWALALAAASTEYAGVLGLMVGAGRRYDGPMGKSDCAFAIGLLGLLLAGGWVGAKTVDGFAMVLAVLCAATVLRRVAAGLREAAQRRRDPIECLCEAVDGGGSLILFPEGTRNTEEGVLPFKSGIYHLARHRPELEFVPVWIDNLKRVMPKGKWLPLPLLCTTTFGEPLRLGASEDKHAFLERTRAALLALSPEQMEAAWLFLGIAAVLLLATLMSETLRWRARAPQRGARQSGGADRAWWVMAAVVALAFVFGRIGVIVLFALVSLFALREFITLAPTRRGDYYALLAAFYIVLP